MRVRLADVEQPVGDRVDDELIVAVRLLGALGGGGVPRRLGLGRLGQQLGVVGREEVELPVDELVEAAPAAGISHELLVERQMRLRRRGPR